MAVFGIGCLRGNITAFGGNQYKLPEESQIFQLFFSLQIMFVKGGALMSRIFSPVVRQDIKCFGANDCYPLAFGLTLVTMFLAFLITLAGKPFYVHRPVSENIFMKVCGCAFYSLKKKFKSNGNDEKKNHWLDYAEDTYEPQLIEDTKKVFKILKVFIPVPIFWSVYMQQSSRWIFQATRMDGDLGFYTIKPDQMIALNPISSITLIPVCNYVFYPLLSKINLGGLLARTTIGGFLCFTAFCIATVVESIIQENRISMLWLAPQWIIVALSENFFMVSVMNFAYTEGPANMKSVMTACVYTTIAIGNIFVTLISGAKIFSSQVYEFIFFLTILFFGMILFAILAFKFRKSQEIKQEDAEN
jgi:solute carrier family 15 oligopeptide transporter 1